MSTVHEDVLYSPSAPAAGNTVESLTPHNVLGGTNGLPSVQDLDAVAEEEAIKAETSGTDTDDTFVPDQFEKDTVAAYRAGQPVSHAEFQVLADAVQELAERIKKYNKTAPHKILEL